LLCRSLRTLHQLAKQQRSDWAIQAIQSSTQEMLLLSFRSLAPSHRLLVERVLQELGTAVPPWVLQRVIDFLLVSRDPVDYFQTVVDAVCNGTEVSSKELTSPVAASLHMLIPSPKQQLVAMATLCGVSIA
jgi:hypothetical protein